MSMKLKDWSENNWECKKGKEREREGKKKES